MKDYRSLVYSIAPGGLCPAGALLLPNGGVQAGLAMFARRDLAAAMAAARTAAASPLRRPFGEELHFESISGAALIVLSEFAPPARPGAHELMLLISHVFAAVAITEQDAAP